MSSDLTDELKSLVCHMAIHNSEASYKQVFQLLFNPLFGFAFSMVRSKEQAEEVASDVLFRIWQNRVDLLQVEKPRVYAFVMARNLSLNIMKKNARLRLLEMERMDNSIEQEHNPEQIMIHHQSEALLQQSINALPARCRLVFKLVKEEGLSYREVAEVLSISSKTVDAHLVTAMKKLSEALKYRKIRSPKS